MGKGEIRKLKLGLDLKEGCKTQKCGPCYEIKMQSYKRKGSNIVFFCM